MDETIPGPAALQSDAAPPSSIRQRLLVLGCSRRQRPDPSPLPAIARYDGPSFRVLRRYLRQTGPVAHDLSVFVFSAEHGLIPGSLPILPYNRTMTVQRAHELQPEVAQRVAAHAAQAGRAGQSAPVDLLISCTRAYLPALAGLSEYLPAGSTVQVAPVRPGERLSCLHDWLHGRPPLVAGQPSPMAAPSEHPVAVRLRGVQVTLSARDLLALAREAFAEQPAATRAPTTWAVDLDGSLVSPKWLVSLGFGLPRSAFGASEALRVLASLGITARRLPV